MYFLAILKLIFVHTFIEMILQFKYSLMDDLASMNLTTNEKSTIKILNNEKSTKTYFPLVFL